MKFLTVLAALIFLSTKSAWAHNHHPAAGLANATILIVRHAEEAETGPGLGPVGAMRARAYARYFSPFVFGGQRLRIDTLVAAADSAESQRSRLTLEPLSHALRVPIQQPYADHHVRALASWLADGRPGRTILIAWHHGEIPHLLTALGLDPHTVLHHGRWPDHVYDQVVLLRFDRDGALMPDACRLIQEPARLP